MTTREPPRLGTPRAPGEPRRADDPDRRMAERLAPRRPDDLATERRPTARHREPPRERRSGSFGAVAMLAWIFGGLVVLMVAAGAVLMVIGPSDLIRDRLVAEVKSRTGRDLEIKGRTSFMLFPTVGVSLGDVSLSAPPGMNAPATVVAKALDISVAAVPLLQSRIVVEQLVLRQPVIDLRVDQSGRRSWQFASLSDNPLDNGPANNRPIRLAQAGKAEPIPAELDAFIKGSTPKPATRAASPATGPAATFALDQVSLGDVRIDDGTVTYTDQRSGVSERVTKLNATVAANSLAQPASLKGDAVVRGERLDFALRLASPARLIQGTPVKVGLDVKGRPGATSFNGTITLAKGLDGDGDLTIDAASLPGLLRFAGLEMPAGGDIGGVDIAGRVRTTDTTVSLSDATIRIDRTDLAGTIALDVGAARPLIRATLTSPAIDVDRIEVLVAALGKATPVKRTPAATAPAPAGAPAGPRTISDLLGEPAATPQTAPAPRVKGSTQRGGWSDDPFDLTALGLADLEGRFTLGRIVQRSFKAGRTQATVVLKARNLRLTVDDIELYEGRGKGTVSLDATTPAVGLGANITVDGVAARSLLKDLALGEGLAGRGRVTMAVAGSGQSERQIIETLDGKADLSVTDGALIGYNIPQIIRSIGQFKFSGIDRTPTEKTDFSELAASFTISKGIARTTDIRMSSPLLRLGGAGDVNLPERLLDLGLRPKLVGTLAGQGGDGALAGIELPVRLVGPWDRPRVEPDQAALNAILNDPNKAVDAVKELGRQFKGKNAEEIVRGVLGGATGEQGQVNPGKILEKLFKP